MRDLSKKEIEKLATLPNVQGDIVRAILSKIGPESSTDVRDLFFTARMQGWTIETVTAIIDGMAYAATPRNATAIKREVAKINHEDFLQVKSTNQVPASIRVLPKIPAKSRNETESRAEPS